MTSRVIATSVKLSGVEVTSLPFFKALPWEHRYLFKHWRKSLKMCISVEKTYRSYCMILVFDIDNLYHAWDLIYRRLRDIVVKYGFWYLPMLDTNKTVRSEHVELEHYEFSLVNRRPNKPKLTFSLYKFKQDRALEKSLLPYRNLFIILRPVLGSE